MNDVLGVTTFNGSCGTCHDTPNAGNHSVKAPWTSASPTPEPKILRCSTLPDCR
jgi:cytochrome c peroxidase